MPITPLLRLDEAADDAAAEVEVRDEGLALQRASRVVSGEVSLVRSHSVMASALVLGEAVQRADGVGHDLGGDRAHVVVGPTSAASLASDERAAPFTVVAALAAVGHRSLQRVSLCLRRQSSET